MKWADHYWYKIPCVKARIEEIVRRVDGKGKTVLEAGCNEGFLSQALIEAGCWVTSVDNDAERINDTEKMFGIKAIKADLNFLPFRNETFDIAVGGEVLEHFNNPGLGLKELLRVSRKKVVISLPLGTYWLGESAHQWSIEAAAIEHDQGIVTNHDKELIVIEFKKR